MNTDINCLHPIRILHPSYLSFAVVSDQLVIFDGDVRLQYNITDVIKGKLCDGFNFFRLFSIKKKLYSLNSFFLNSNSGEVFPVFMDVPCGHCDACNAKRQNGIIQRLNFGFEEDQGQSLYVTLTYNEKHLPVNGVCRRDVQLFKKRVNKLVFDLFKMRLKYGYFSEYGDDGRPHYHMIIYGMPFLSYKSSYSRFEYFSRLLQFCWRKFPKSGYSSVERYSFKNYLKRGYRWFNVTEDCKNKDPYSMGFVNVEFPNSGNCFGYISKYISKSSNVPVGKLKNFYNLSNNLGVSWLTSRLDNINKDTSKFVYRSKFGSSVKELYLSSYYIKKLFPSFSSLVPVEFRRKWLSFHYDTLWLAENPSLPSYLRLSVLNLLYEVHKRFPSLCPILDLKVDLSGQEVYSLCYYRDSWHPDISDDFFRSYLDSCLFFLRYDYNFESYVNEMVFKRDCFLKNYSRISQDPLLCALKFSKTHNRYVSSKIF